MIRRELNVRRNLLFKVSIVSSFLGGVLLFPQQREPQHAIEEATEAFREGKTLEAKQKLHSVLEGNPSDLRALVLIVGLRRERKVFSAVRQRNLPRQITL